MRWIGTESHGQVNIAENAATRRWGYITTWRLLMRTESIAPAGVENHDGLLNPVSDALKEDGHRLKARTLPSPKEKDQWPALVDSKYSRMDVSGIR